MRLSIIAITVAASCAVAWIAAAGVVQTHYGATVPTDEGWTRQMSSGQISGIPNEIEFDEPVVNDVGYGGLLVRRALTGDEIAYLATHGAENANFLIPEPSSVLLLLIGLLALACRRRG